MSEQSDALNRAVRDKGLSIYDLQARPIASSGGVANRSSRADLPRVPLPRQGMQMIDFAEEVGAIVGANGLFRRESVPVTIDPESGRVEEMDPSRFQTYVETQLTPVAWRGNSCQAETMTLREAQACLRSDALVRPLRKLRRVNLVSLPVMRADGRIELLPKGYDEGSGICTMKESIEYDTSWTVERAKLYLDYLLGEFPFADERSRAVHILAMLAVFGADLLPPDVKRLNFVYRANMPRAGKGLLACTAIVGPHGRVLIQSIPDESSEFKKILDTEALNGSPYIFLDEVDRKLVNRTLNSFLTASMWTGRLMNSQKKFAVPQSAIVFMAGNGVEISTDLAGRCLLVDLYVSQADPQQREIRNVIDESYLARPFVRGDILSALWALVRHWDKLGRPRPSSTFRGFEVFCSIFGGMVEAAGYGCALKSVAEHVDPDFADMRAIVEKLSEGISSRAEYEFPAIIDVCRELNAFEWLLIPKRAGSGDDDGFKLDPKARSIIGKTFGAYGGTSFVLSDGRQVRFGSRGRNRQRRYLVEVL